MNTYNRFHSLGFNCEIGMFLRNVGHKQFQDYFTWSLVPFEQLMRLIETSFADAFLRDNIYDDGLMIVDRVHEIATHKPLPKYIESLRSENELLDYVASERHRRAHWFLESLRQGVPTAHVVKYEGDNAQQDAMRLRDALHKKGADDRSILIFVQEQDRRESDWDISGIANRYITKFAPYLDVQAYDQASWVEALSPFKVALPDRDERESESAIEWQLRALRAEAKLEEQERLIVTLRQQISIPG